MASKLWGFGGGDPYGGYMSDRERVEDKMRTRFANLGYDTDNMRINIHYP